MDLSLKLVLIQGEPKTVSIDNIFLNKQGVYKIAFKGRIQFYSYRNTDVTILENPTAYDPLQCKVIVEGSLHNGIQKILSFDYREQKLWRITYNNGYEMEYLPGQIEIVQSCLSDNTANNSWEYLKHVAYANELGKSEDNEGILSYLYNKITEIDNDLAAAPYLNPNGFKMKVRKNKSTLIFPFGCNASQEKAVKAAFANQISVIQGPPGTGKTQTILNIIANIVIQKKTVLVVSNNNSATANVLEKLHKYGFGFICASLGKKENKTEFLEHQPIIPEFLNDWNIPKDELNDKVNQHNTILDKLRKVFALQESLAISRQSLKDLKLEWEHFKEENHVDENTYDAKAGLRAGQYMDLWLNYQAFSENDHIAPQNFLGKLKEKLKWFWMNFTRKYRFKIKTEFKQVKLSEVILELQTLYYITKLKELEETIYTSNEELSGLFSDDLNKKLTEASVTLFKYGLYKKYISKKRREFSSDDLNNEFKVKEFLEQFPVVLSTTFSAKSSLNGSVKYDYLIMDEASQVSVETGALALGCAKNAVIVGDNQQLPNVITQYDKLKLEAIFNEFNVDEGYNSAEYSFLDSVCKIIPDVHQTMLREHYRCHPKIINFCNQKFYGGNLVIMTKDNEEEDVMMAIKTVPGQHRRGNYNQREIDVVTSEILPEIDELDQVGIITPYVAQKLAFNSQIPGLEADTIHKYQGREKDYIILSCVDDQISDFSDDPNLLNVAISRAKKRFCLILTGNEQERKGNICDLVDYINYNNFTVTDSKVKSIFDYLYSQYTKERIALLSRSKNISTYDSENLTYLLLTNILKTHIEFSHLDVICHVPLRTIINDTNILTEEEKKYTSNYSTHIDFLIYNRVSKKPVLAVETDGFNFHNKLTNQYNHDQMKNHILESCCISLLRLSTAGSGEKKKVVMALSKALS